MDQGTLATYYTHTGNDGINDTVDEVALVLRESGGNVDLVVFPPGGPTKYVTVREFDPEDPYIVDGGSYVREEGTEAPDFQSRFRYSGDPEYAAALNRIRKERDDAPGNRREELKKQHKQQMADVVKRLDEKNRPEGEGGQDVQRSQSREDNPQSGQPTTPNVATAPDRNVPRNPPGGPPNPSPAGRREV